MISLKQLMHRLLGYKVSIVCEKGPAKDDEPYVSRCWLASDCTLRARWHNKQVILKSDKSVVGFPKEWLVTWERI
ncbi:hypothetical protein I3271_07040 [Photobacterium leiognathi]|uniref:hypothetical protein n=1 Tax=Photobacterium leiognathi TaxID=553611 RepID=UPI001EE0C084|nr:hypothetical protein [Photobacterium leiognathi]MCG3884441.1 hypothetical protein [Photobacterium leiognathi]